LLPRVRGDQRTIEALGRLRRPGEPVFMGDLNDSSIRRTCCARSATPTASRRELAEPADRSCIPTSPGFRRACPSQTLTDREQRMPADRRPRAALAGDVTPSDHWPVLAVYEIQDFQK
jgi:hypothetical protein